MADNLGYTEAIRIEWLWAWARAQRWAEQKQKVVEEMRCVVKFSRGGRNGGKRRA
ncbi:hypothetical protein M422DRAFT_270736 [Sphaerobolus stellatus SS14]|uniref:Uncharacterized protein n=1 Tax=Sphaerobolus stellatus (strain SS14) TaxID=990650 RepID=A0A0C9UGE5_SPHS4|nr:hypothetical protein M422DRAFT_270736 [Sphaerobolus stellatus SS14]